MVLIASGRRSCGLSATRAPKQSQRGNPRRVPFAAPDTPSDFGSIGCRVRRSLALVPGVIAMGARGDDVAGDVSAALAPRHQMLGGALQTRCRRRRGARKFCW